MDLGTGIVPAPVNALRPLIPECAWPLARTLFYMARGTSARTFARVGQGQGNTIVDPVFIIGCGRSGTTLLGQLLAAHPAVTYLYEPDHLWAAIESSSDSVRLYTRGVPHCMLQEGSLTPVAQRRFKRLMSPSAGATLVEKSPINALRIGYLCALAPDARFVHIVRDGVDVARSIENEAAVTRKMAFRQPLNEWWGVGGAKWTALQQDGGAAGYYPDEVGELTTDAERGAYEWLVSLREIGSRRLSLGLRLTEIRYPDLTGDPRAVLRDLTKKLDLPCPQPWLESATARVRPAVVRAGSPLMLPARMCADFNDYQRAFGFSQRAVAR